MQDMPDGQATGGGSSWDTHAIRSHAHQMEAWADAITAQAGYLADNPLPTWAWGIDGYPQVVTGGTGTSEDARWPEPYPGDPVPDWQIMTVGAGQNIPELGILRRAYGEAHRAAVGRLEELARVHNTIALALRSVADGYDRTEGVDGGRERQHDDIDRSRGPVED